MANKQYWLMKTEPETFSYDDIVKQGQSCWDGVRNYTARNNMAAMKNGDRVLIYHSVNGKEVVGIAEVVRESYPDPTIDDQRWVAVDVKPIEKLKNPVTLETIKKDPALQEMALIKLSRLSVQPVKKEEFDHIVKLSQKD
jgi:predicted RNA-binding protein with PUA-like domain